MTVSGGGPSAISFAAMFPQRTKALIAIEAASQPLTGVGLPEFLQSDFNFWLVINILESLGNETIVSMMVPDHENQMLILNDSRKVNEFIDGIWSLWPISIREEGMKNDLLQFSQMNLEIERITAPTLIIHGTADRNVLFADSEKLAVQIQGSIFHKIEGADHMMILTHQEEIAGEIEQFINDNNFAE